MVTPLNIEWQHRGGGGGGGGQVVLESGCPAGQASGQIIICSTLKVGSTIKWIQVGEE